jgi:hypothetical protein
MKPLRQAIDDYIRLRRSLGFKLRDVADDLQNFATFMEQKTAPVTTELAMQWAMQPADHQPSGWAQRLGFVRVFARHWHATDAHGDSPGRFTPVSATTFPPLSVFGTGDSKVVGSRPEAISQPGPTTADISLPVRVVGGGRVADQ